METLTQPIVYPDSDGKPVANNTEHLEWITRTKHGIESVVADREDVLVAADLFWYPVEGKPRIALAPDVMVAFGRPKGARKSYKQWEENGIAPQIVFEFLSDSNTPAEMAHKAMFFDRYGVQEYYIYDIEHHTLGGFVRYNQDDDHLEEIPDAALEHWRSPRLGIVFDMTSGTLVIRKPDGTPFLSYEEYVHIEHLLDETRSELSETRSELSETRNQLHASQQRASELAAKLRAMGINPDE